MRGVFVCAAIFVACSSDPIPQPEESALDIEGCSCLRCGCPDTTGLCYTYSCDFNGVSHRCVRHDRPYGFGPCQDYGAPCIEVGHCDGKGNCKAYIGVGNKRYTCLSDQPLQWACGCYFDGTWRCRDSNDPPHYSAKLPACGEDYDNGSCTFSKRCN